MIAYEIQLRYVIRDKIQSGTSVRDKIESETIFLFCQKKNFVEKFFFSDFGSDRILSQTLSRISSVLF